MEISKRVNVNKYNNYEREIFFRDEDKILRIFFAGNLDLYFMFSSKKDKTFEITKENYFIYEKFLELYNDIKNNNLFDIDDSDLLLWNVKTVEDLNNLYEENRERNEFIKSMSHYDELFHDGIITWNSDDGKYDIRNAGSFSIIKEEDKFVLKFSDKFVSVKLSNIGSYYGTYNFPFIDMFNELIRYDKNDKQIHIEEYLYEEKMKKVRKK